MVGPNAERRLAAVLALDIVGFSAMMNQDELGTLRRVQAFQREIVAPLVQSNRGRVFKLIGDGALADFQSVHDAFAAALAILEDLAASDLDLRVRIGLHIGDLIFEDGDVFGDGVNIAARLEGVAQPGSIAVSERAWIELGKTHTNFRDLGRLSLKNIREPIRVFQFDPKVSPKTISIFRILRKARMPFAIIIVFTLLGAGAWMLWQNYYGSPKRQVNDVILNLPCSWLGVSRVVSKNGLPIVEVEGGSSLNKLQLAEKIRVAVARRSRTEVLVSAEKIGRLPPNLCDFVDRFKDLRYNGPKRLMLTEMKQVSKSDNIQMLIRDRNKEDCTEDCKKVINDIIEARKSDEGVVNFLTFRYYNELYGNHSSVFAVTEGGRILDLFDLNDAKARPPKMDDGTRVVEILTQDVAWALLIIDSNRPVPKKVVHEKNLSVSAFDRLRRAAEEGEWNIEMVWFKSQQAEEKSRGQSLGRLNR